MTPLASLRLFAEDQERRIRQQLAQPYQSFHHAAPHTPAPLPIEQQWQPWHGTLNGYSHHKCRCYDCRRAYTDYRRAHPTRHRVERTLKHFRLREGAA